MANPSGNHQEPTSFNGVSAGATNPNNGNSAPESSGAALAMKHNPAPGISLDWTPDEQAILEEGLAK